MAYSVTKLAKLSGVSVRTLHWYDEVGLLKPSYHGTNRYRFYEEKELLALQQILFFRELGFELKTIKKVMGRSDFDTVLALSSHREVLKKNLERTKKLIKTIDKTIKHLQGTRKMKEQDMYYGFSKEQQAEYEKELIERFGDKVKPSIAECRRNVKGWTKNDWDKSQKEMEAICKELAELLKKGIKPESKEVQSLVQRHYEWLKKFWTPTKESYASHADFIVERLRVSYAAYHPQLPEYLAKAIQEFAAHKL